ncbi:MAG TPA: hypothetical protein P5545_03360 [Bacteroidota bacterium]|nr:hypothetical protein [Bacteroidota bacterium]
MKRLIYIFIFILLQIFPVFSQNYISIHDSTLPRTGYIYSLPIYSNIDLKNANNVLLKIYFNYNLIDVKNIVGGTNYAFNELNPSFTIDATNPDNAILQISSNQINPNYSGVLCTISLETLVGQDSIAIFSPFYLEINATPINDISFSSGRIFIGDPVYPVLHEGISQIYPNPFSFSENVIFAVEDTTTVNFNIYSILGQLVTEIPGSSMLNYRVYDNTGKEIPDITNYKYPRGIYRLYFESIPWKFSSGAYSIVMVSKKGTFRSNFIYLK